MAIRSPRPLSCRYSPLAPQSSMRYAARALIDIGDCAARVSEYHDCCLRAYRRRCVRETLSKYREHADRASRYVAGFYGPLRSRSDGMAILVSREDVARKCDRRIVLLLLIGRCGVSFLPFGCGSSYNTQIRRCSRRIEFLSLFACAVARFRSSPKE